MARLTDGFKTTVSFSLKSSIKFYEREVTPPAVDGGGENDTTTMRNTTWRTKAPKKLKTLGNMALSVAYDPACYTDILSMLNSNQEITVTFSDTSTIKFWGWLNTFTPQACKEGEQPTADCEIIASNQNNSAVETAPTITAV